MKQNRSHILLCLFILISSMGCREVRMNEHENWGEIFKQNGIENGCFMLRDQTHESIHYFNKDRCIDTFSPASTFKILNSLVALEMGVAKDDQLLIPWDGMPSRDICDTAMTMRRAFALSCVNYYQELARRNGKEAMQHFLDTVKYGNMNMGKTIDNFWLDNSLKISPDEQLGLMRKLYFNELPFSELNQRIVRSMMLKVDEEGRRLAYKTGWGEYPDGHATLWVVGYEEIIKEHEEMEGARNKSGIRTYPYFFVLNFDITNLDKAWVEKRIVVLEQLLKAFHEGK